VFGTQFWGRAFGGGKKGGQRVLGPRPKIVGEPLTGGYNYKEHPGGVVV